MLTQNDALSGGSVLAWVGGSISALWRDAAMHAESVSGMWQAAAWRYWVIARYNMGSLLPMSAPTSRLPQVVAEESTGVEASLASDDQGFSSADLLSSVSSILHQAKDEASHLLSSASALWDVDDSACSSAGRFLGACTGAEAPAPVDFWHICSTENMCMAESPTAECPSLCGLFRPSHSNPSAHSPGLELLSHVSSETQKALAAGFSMGFTGLITAWDAVKQSTAQGVQFKLPVIQQPRVLGRLQSCLSSAEQLRNVVLGKDVDWDSIDVTSLVSLALVCCLALTFCALAVGVLGSAFSPPQTKSQVRCHVPNVWLCCHRQSFNITSIDEYFELQVPAAVVKTVEVNASAEALPTTYVPLIHIAHVDCCCP